MSQLPVKQGFVVAVGLMTILALSSLACLTQSSTEATAQALSAMLDITATARAVQGGESSGESLATAQAQATQRSMEAAATQTAVGQIAADAGAATATAVAPIAAELPTYGVDPAVGRLAWIHPPALLTVEGYLQYDYANQLAGTLASDFVMSSEITWNTQTGVSGCGFVLRSNGNEESLSQYIVALTRAGNGNVFFIKQENGDVISQENIYANDIDPAFEWQNDTTNQLTVVAQGDTFTIYTNGTFVAEVTATEYDRGFVAMVALSESGTTICQFENTWLWLIE